MYSRGLLLLSALLAAAQPPEPILKSNSLAVQMEVFVNDPSGNPVHGLHKNDFAITDNGRPRDIRIFSGEIDANDAPPQPELTVLPPGVYSNRFGLQDAPIVTAIVIDAMLRPEGLQLENGRGAGSPPGANLKMAVAQAMGAVNRMAPGAVMAVYAACPDLHLIQDFTSDPARLQNSLRAFTVPCAPKATGRAKPRTIDAFVPPMLFALREAARHMSSASGRKSIVWLSQAYGTELDLAAVKPGTDATILALNDANVPLYAIDTRFNPTCRTPQSPPGPQTGIVPRFCAQDPDASVWWLEGFAQATGGRAFIGGAFTSYEVHDAQGRLTYGYTSLVRTNSVTDAILSAIDDSRYAYDMGFYVPDSELDGKLHTLGVQIPAKPKLGLRYRSSYTASQDATAPAPAPESATQTSDQPEIDSQNPTQVGIDASVAKSGAELRVSLSLDPATVTTSSDNLVVLDETFTETDINGKLLANIQETVSVPPSTTPCDMIRSTRTAAFNKKAVLFHITIRDQATGRVGTLAIPLAN